MAFEDTFFDDGLPCCEDGVATLVPADDGLFDPTTTMAACSEFIAAVLVDDDVEDVF